MPGSTGSSMRGTAAIPLALIRTCQAWGGEITTSPPMSWLQCMWLRKAAESRRRSEEHTSELQSQSNLVCRLLLEKKKNTDKYELRLVIICARTVLRSLA